MGNQLKRIWIGGDSNMFDFDKWIVENGFNAMKQVLINNHLNSFDNLINIDHNNFDLLLMGDDKISQNAHLKRSIIVAIQNLKQLRNDYIAQNIDIDSNSANSISTRLFKLYNENIRKMEEMFHFSDFGTPSLSKIDFLAKPMILIVGSYSTGKTSMIRHIIRQDIPENHINPEPTTDAFYAIMYGEEKRIIHGWPLTIDTNKPFKTLSKFGAGFLNKFKCAELSAPILQNITFVDSPGILSGAKRRLGRNYDFFKVMQWFICKCDRVLFVFDATRLDISDELKATLEAFKGYEDKFHCVINKADCISNQELLRVYGALMWSLAKVFKNANVFKVYIGSFWDRQYWNKHNKQIFDDAVVDLIDDIRGLPRVNARRKLLQLQNRIRKIKAHACIVQYLRGNSALQLDDLRSKFKQIARNENLDISDFPNPQKFKILMQKHDISNFPTFTKEWRRKLEYVLNVEIPKLMKEIPLLRTELMVYGYIREMERELRMIIPVDIWIEITVFCE